MNNGRSKRQVKSVPKVVETRNCPTCGQPVRVVQAVVVRKEVKLPRFDFDKFKERTAPGVATTKAVVKRGFLASMRGLNWAFKQGARFTTVKE